MSAPGVDERALGAGTTARFVLLFVLIMVTSALMTLNVAYLLTSGQTNSSLKCSLASGVDPTNPSIASAAHQLTEIAPYVACMARHAPPPPWWLPTVWSAAVFAAGAAAFALLPGWKRRRVVALDAPDLVALLGELHTLAGPGRAPRFVVDPAAVSTGAVVFGRNRKPFVRIDGGLLARRHVDPDRFRAVMLHEIAHVRNGDVTLTYLTVGVWRAFLVLVLPAHVVLQVRAVSSWIGSELWAANGPLEIRNLLLTAVLLALVTLARADVLRSREIYADRAALRWGAHAHSWADIAPRPRTTLGRALAPVLEPWSTHPRWNVRRDSLVEPVTLFGIAPFPLMLTGAAATLISTDVQKSFEQYQHPPGFGLLSEWANQAVELSTAGLVVVVVGIAMWRAVVRTVLAGHRVPSGIRAGLWLGAGMAVSDVLVNQADQNTALPDAPAALLGVVLAGVAVTWWLTQCAELGVRVWRGPTLRPPLTVCLVGGCLALAWWFSCWETGAAAIFTVGQPLTPAGMGRLMAQQMGTGTATPSAPTIAFGLASVVMFSVLPSPLAPFGVAALAVVPLAGWLLRPTRTPPRWALHASPGATLLWRPPPGPRRVLLPGLLAGVACWAAMRFVAEPGDDSDSATAYVAWLAVVLLAGALVASTVAAALAGRYRLIAAVIAAQTAVLIGELGAVFLLAQHGCSRWAPWLTCHVAGASPWSVLVASTLLFLMPTLTLATVLATAVALVLAVVDRRQDVAPAQPVPRLVLRRVAIATIAASALALAGDDAAVVARAHANEVNLSATQTMARQVLGVTPVPASPHIRALQIDAWRRMGGNWLTQHLTNDWTQYLAALRVASQPGHNTWTQAQSQFTSVCADFARLARIASGYFDVPEPIAQSHWQTAITLANRGSQHCQQALTRQNSQLFRQATLELRSAATESTATSDRAEAVQHVGGP